MFFRQAVVCYLLINILIGLVGITATLIARDNGGALPKHISNTPTWFR